MYALDHIFAGNLSPGGYLRTPLGLYYSSGLFVGQLSSTQPNPTHLITDPT